MRRFLTARYEWPWYLAVMLVTSVVVGFDVDRFATLVAPPLILAIAATSDADSRIVILSLMALQAVAMEVVLPWYSDKPFYRCRYAAYSQGHCIAQMILTSAALVGAVWAIIPINFWPSAPSTPLA